MSRADVCPVCKGKKYILLPISGNTTALETALCHNCNGTGLELFSPILLPVGGHAAVLIKTEYPPGDNTAGTGTGNSYSIQGKKRR